MFGPLRERIEAAVEKVEGMLVGFLFSSLTLLYFAFREDSEGFSILDEKQLMVGCVGVWCPDG